MPKLNDTQSVLLATAAQHECGSLYPLPETLTPGARVTNALATLLTANLIAERETSSTASFHRTDGALQFGLFVTPAGLQAIGIEPADKQPGTDAQAPSPPPPPAAGRETKASQVVALLSRPDGATLAELIEATGWLPHTTRAALTGLRKKGHTIERARRDDSTCYFARAASAA